MQDDLLMDKTKSQQRQQQQQQSASQQQQQDSGSISEAPCAAEPPSTEISVSAPPTLKEKMQMESPILPGLSFPQQEPPAGPSLSPSFGSTWSTGGTSSAVDDSFFQGIPPVNGTMLFQNFPHHHHHVSPVFGGTFSPQLGLAHQNQQQRRSPVSPSNHPPYNQRNAYSHQAILTNKPSSSSSSSSPSSWNNQHNAAWNNPTNPWGGLQPGRDPRRAVGVGVGVGVGVPSPLNPISPLKKPFSSNVIAPPKFPRASPMAPKSWVEDNVFRTDNGNNLLPMQVI